jgi:dTMP kinase
MTPESNSGILLAVEGVDGAGKTTQVGLLADALRRAGLEVVTSKEPTDGRWGRIIRESAETGRMTAFRELYTFIKDRQEHVATKVQPALDRNAVVILDRYFYSTIAYQGSRSGVDWMRLDRILRQRAPVPDLVFVLDIDPAVSLLRIKEGRGEIPNQFEQLDGLQAARDIFQKLCRIDNLLVEIDGNMPPEAVHASIVGHFIRRPLRSKRCAKEYGCSDPHHCAPRMTGSCDWIKLARVPLSLQERQYRGLAQEIAGEAWATDALTTA